MMTTSSSSDDGGSSYKHRGMLTGAVGQLQGILNTLWLSDKKCQSCRGGAVRSGRSSRAESAVVLDGDDEDLEVEAHGAQEQFERIQIQMKHAQLRLKKKEDETHDLQSRVRKRW